MVVLMLRAWLLAAAFAWAAAASAQPEGELRIKAAYVYKLAGFVEWPESAFAGAGAPFVIGVAGSETFAAELEDATGGRTMQNRKVEVRRIARGAPVQGAHILFIADAENARIADIAAAVRGQPILIVTESESATTRGSMINFIVADNKVRFDVAPAPAEKGRLRISARLLTVARRVIGGTS